jgi:hypothetical protein
MKLHGREEVQLHTPNCFTPVDKVPTIHWVEGCMGLKSWSGHRGEEKDLWSSQQLNTDSLVFQSPADPQKGKNKRNRY